MGDKRKEWLFSACVSFLLLTCFVAGAAGDVPDGVVYTDLHKTVQKGNEIVLSCEFYEAPIAVYWKKGDDPERGTDLISWAYEEEISGSCVNNKACHMTDDYSLVIADARIADQGRYICRVSNYLGILIHNFTDVNIYAPPNEPYPIIDECTTKDVSTATQICSIQTNNTINITCSASRFFPDLNLFFLHESNKITNIGSNVRENEDGTKNKSIMIKASASEIHYVCVASDIPGLKDERTATVFLSSTIVPTPQAPDTQSLPFQTTTTNPVILANAGGTSTAKIVVPMVILVIVAVAGITFLLWKRYKRRGTPETTDVEETMPMVEPKPMVQKMTVEGVVSFYELWLLAYYTPKEDMGKVRSALIKLGITGIEGQLRREQVYDALCGWKETAKTPIQAQKLKDALEKVKLETRWQQIYDKCRQSTTKISEGTLEQILLDLETPEAIHTFLCKLIPDAEMKVDKEGEKDGRADTALISLANTEGNNAAAHVSVIEINPDIAVEKKDVHLEAKKKLRKWNEGTFNQNPFVLVSLALERAGYSHVSKTFFEGTLSFYELRSLLYDMDTPSLEKVRKTLRELEIEDEVEGVLGPQQLYEAFCGWKEKHNQVDQGKILRDALERANFEEAWLKILEQRKKNSEASDGTLKQILLDIKDPLRIQQFIGNLVLCSAINLKASTETDVIQQAMEVLREWNRGPFVENPIVLLSYALERAGCNPVDRTFFYETLSYFELWAMVHGNLEAGVEISDLRQALLALGIPDIKDKTTEEQFYILLCEWKDKHPTCDQLLVLKVYLIESGLNNVWQDIRDRRNGADRILSEDMLEHILWHITDPNKIKTFLQKLSQNNLESGLVDSKPIKDNIRAALVELVEWKKKPFDKHPVVLLSLALESAECTPVDKTFFKVPAFLQKPIYPQEVELFVNKLTSRHCKRLTNEMPNIGEERIFDNLDENNTTLFDTKSLICDWIANEECCNYDKRCTLDDVLINIGRHDMTDCFGTIEFRRNTEDLSKKLHPMSKHFNHETIFDDDLIQLKKLIDCLNLDMMSEFCMKLGLSYDERGETTKSPGDQELRQWRDSNMTLKSKEVFSEITQLMGDRTYVNHITDGELEYLASQVNDDDKKEKLLSPLKIDGDKKRWKWKRNTKRTSTVEKMQDGPDKKTEHADEGSTSKGKEDKETSNIHDEKDEQVDLTLVDVLKVWRNKLGDQSCRRTLRAALKSIGIEECLVNKTPRKYMYEAELVRVAFYILMRDVYPVIKALWRNQRKFMKYIGRGTGVDKGSIGLLQQICQGKNKSEAYHRRNFCLILAKLGYVDVARSTYLDYEQSTCELSRIASCLEKAKFPSLIDHLGLSPDELTQCQGTNGEADGLEAMRVWKNLIRPEPYYYRLHIVYSLQGIGWRGLADEVLRGHYRQAAAEDDIIKGICSRLADSQIKDLCGLLKLKSDEDRMISITAVVKWVNQWMQKYDPNPTAVIASDRFHQRKRKNNELVEAGFYELAHEIMILEYSIF